MIKFAVAIGFLALNFYTYNFLADNAVIPERNEFSEFPLEIGDWECANTEVMEDKVENNLGVTDYLLCNFAREEPPGLVGVYVGYHATQVREEGGGAGENSIHPPAHCLPGSGWDIIKNESVELDLPGLPGGPSRVKRLVIARGNARQLVYYWYQSRGRVVSDDWKKILYVGWDRATRSRTDGSLVRFTIPISRNDDEAAQATFDSFAPQIIPRLSAFVPE
ncbi:EpsI family protein [Myxococcota bacterium]|nr:EpsI family protein [Myxococcota bacterium]